MLNLSALFPDFDPDKEYKDFSIELETSVPEKTMLDSKYSGIAWTSETERIKEIASAWKHKDIRNIREDIRTYRKVVAPVGSDSYLSGGNHFHVMTTDTIQNWISNRFKKKEMLRFEKLLGRYPLHAIPYSGRLFYRPRRNSSISEISWDAKFSSITLKRSYMTQGKVGSSSSGIRSIEFRTNSVCDPRLYGYWIAMLSIALDEKEENRVNGFNEESHLNPVVKTSFASPEVSLSYLYAKNAGCVITDAMRSDFVNLVRELGANFPKAATALFDYLVEYDIIKASDAHLDNLAPTSVERQEVSF